MPTRQRPTTKVAKTTTPSGATRLKAPPALAPVAEAPQSKMVRDSFTFPAAEYEQLKELKQRAIKLARPAKKSEVLRAGLLALQAMNDRAFGKAIDAVPTIKTGRPKAKKSADPAAEAPAAR
ncbi:MAG: hypothetical protein ABIS28_08320 [Caldimonas sp.]